MTKSKKRGFDKNAAHIRNVAAVSAATTSAVFPKKTRNKYPNEQLDDKDWSMMGLGSLGKGPVVPKGTGMQELARNTRNKAAHWDQSSKLRDRPVTFVSGGCIEPVDELEHEPPVPVDQSLLAMTSTAVCTAIPVAAETNNAQTYSRHGANYNATFVPRKSSDSDSDSSTEVILFKGRNKHAPTKPDTDECNSNAADMVMVKQWHSAIPDDHDSPQKSICLDHLLAASDDESGSAAAIDDYIANMLLNDTDEAAKQGQENYSEPRDGKSDLSVDSGAMHSGTDGSTCGADDCKGDDVWRDFRVDSDAPDGKDKQAADIDDENFARLLAKQEELGFEASELILLDGDSVKPEKPQNRVGQSDNQAKSSKGYASRKRALPAHNLRGLKPRDGSYPSAEAVADAFEQLEVTGWGNDHNGFDLGLSDSELEATLLATWQKDSRRKRDRKKAREERRSQGLLGKNANANDTRVKYSNGMSLEDIRSEFQGFLLGAEQSVVLPPMDAHARKIIHELAHRFGITSKSTGAGNQRRPTLVRKKGTLKFDATHFNGVFSRVGRHYFARLDARQTGVGGLQKHRGGNNAAVVVRNGEVVGGSAPEIGQENKGRTMLERMGWSMGMALGAVDNKGMTQPIEHVVKRSKAGLG